MESAKGSIRLGLTRYQRKPRGGRIGTINHHDENGEEHDACNGACERAALKEEAGGFLFEIHRLIYRFSASVGFKEDQHRHHLRCKDSAIQAQKKIFSVPFVPYWGF
jgi:hypothetical protein